MKNGITGLLVGCLVAFAAASAAADTIVPDEWTGIWQMEISVRDCVTNVEYFHSTGMDTICPGANFEGPDNPEVVLICNGTADATTYALHCEGTEAVEPGCTADHVYDIEGLRTGDNYTVTSTLNVAYAVGCVDYDDLCIRTVTTGTRVAALCDGTPAESQPWGTVKTIFR